MSLSFIIKVIEMRMIQYAALWRHNCLNDAVLPNHRIRDLVTLTDFMSWYRLIGQGFGRS